MRRNLFCWALALGLVACQAEGPQKPDEPEYKSFNLSESGCSNAYIIDKEGEYRFDASVRGNGSLEANPSGLTPECTAHLVWQSAKGMISDLSVKEQFIEFKASSTPGNAVIALKRGELIIWSWHIWHPEATVQALKAANGYSVMNMNLGAMKDDPTGDVLKTYGLLYQWGRKDPFPGSPTVTGNVETMPIPVYDASGKEVSIYHTSYNSLELNNLQFSISSPNVVICNYAQYATNRDWLTKSDDNLWGNPTSDGKGTKSIYDPCPAGWRVPSPDVFHDATPSGGYETDASRFNVEGSFNHGWTLYLDKAAGIKTFMPATGRYDGSYGMLYGSVAGLWGNYWSNAPHGQGLGFCPLSFRAESMSPNAAASRADAYSVRCIKE